MARDTATILGVIGGAAAVATGVYFIVKGKATNKRKPGDTITVDFNFKYMGPTREYRFVTALGAIGIIPGTFTVDFDWELYKTVEESLEKPMPRKVTMKCKIPLEASPKKYDGRGQIFVGGELLASDPDANVIEVVGG